MLRAVFPSVSANKICSSHLVHSWEGTHFLNENVRSYVQGIAGGISVCCVLNGFTVEKRGIHVWNLQIFPHLLIFSLTFLHFLWV